MELPEDILRMAQTEYDDQFPGQPYERMQQRGVLSVLEIVRLMADRILRLEVEKSSLAVQLLAHARKVYP
jgi:hypothetical protein